MPPSPLRVHLALLAVSILFGGTYVFSKRVLDAVGPAAWAMFRIVAASAVLVPIAIWLKKGRPWPERRLLLLLGIASLFGVVLNQVLFVEGLKRTTPAHSSVVNACIPIWTLLAAVIAGQERLGPRRLGAIALALGGVQYLLGLDRLLLGTTPDAADDGATLLGDLLTMLNGWSFAIHLVFLRRIGRGLDSWLATAVMFLWAVLLIGAYGAPQATADDLDAVLTPPVLWCALYVVLFATVLTYLLNPWALRHTHSSTVALYINVQPLVAVALGTALGAPLPGHRFYVALALVSAGLWLQTKARD
ncbi:MAG: DMT family transporter [Planctomycetes bacterium]|nr:DMT family transporter [Planctomycetota bacterium]